MTDKLDKKIQLISFPNSAIKSELSHYLTDEGFHFEKVYKNGEMAEICWIRVWKGSLVVCDIKESVCNIYY